MMKLRKSEQWAILLTSLFLAVTVGYHAGRRQSTPDFYVTTEKPAETSVPAKMEQVVLPTETEQSRVLDMDNLPAETEQSTSNVSDLINLNTASAEELQTLIGIGEVLSARIIAYREEYGPFSSVEEITSIQGIGESILEKNRERLTLGEGEHEN